MSSFSVLIFMPSTVGKMVIDHHKPLPAQFLDGFQKLIVVLFCLADSRGNNEEYQVNFLIAHDYCLNIDVKIKKCL